MSETFARWWDRGAVATPALLDLSPALANLRRLAEQRFASAPGDEMEREARAGLALWTAMRLAPTTPYGLVQALDVLSAAATARTPRSITMTLGYALATGGAG